MLEFTAPRFNSQLSLPPLGKNSKQIKTEILAPKMEQLRQVDLRFWIPEEEMGEGGQGEDGESG